MYNNVIDSLSLVIPNASHEIEYCRVMDRWEALETNIKPSLMRRYSDKTGSNVSYEKWLSWSDEGRVNGSMFSTNVPCTIYFLMIDNVEITGCIIMNHDITRRGHLHAGIVPWNRGKGYGTRMLELALVKCSEMGIDRVLITPRNDNIGAINTIIRNGGVLQDEFYDGDDLILRYWIENSSPRK